MRERQFPVIESLPKEEQKPFSEWLAYKTRPINDDGSVGYYIHDYNMWKHQWSNK